jgi:hypothetical protein
MPDVAQRQESVVHFEGEQDGRPERDLKSALVHFLQRNSPFGERIW